MKKILFAFLTVIACAQLIKAQVPTITSADHFEVGDKEVLYVADTTGVTPGDSGAMKIWDFTRLTQNSAKDSVSSAYVSPASTIYGSDFPTADIATQSLNSSSYSYFTYKNSTYSLIGIEGNQTYGGQTYLLKQIYDTPEVLFTYPITYGTRQNSNFKAHYDILGTTAYRNGNNKVIGDGYGTLKIMNKTISNVLRMHNITTQYDSIPGLPGNIVTNSESWVYVLPGRKIPLLTVTLVNQMGQSSKSILYNVSGITSGIITGSDLSSDLSLYPNPATQECRIVFSSSLNTRAELTITNQIGQTIINKMTPVKMGYNPINLDLSAYPKGIYFIRLHTTAGEAVKKLMIE